MATVGDVAEVISLINKIINAAETARALKKDCLELVEFLCYVRKNLEPLEGKPLSDASTVTLRKLEDLLLRAYEVIDGCQRRNFLYLLIRGGRIQHRIKGAHSNIVDYLRLIPIMQQNETQLFLV
ncbi:protein MID1-COMPLEMENTING ACTIVITY 1-like [Canna indica]|uniref:Protein MID1-COMPLEMENTING ACTIVITY 1-like n=1 Tax=Canna indica TaxID=4628 RepID=A0AAQ3Q7L6_9LILI|nr:protein MID1-COMPLEMENTING ACTIVITY 1-like [Canna indica]